MNLKYFRLLEDVLFGHPIFQESSVERLIKYYSTTLSPVQEDWLVQLDTLVTRFYDDEDRSGVRLKMLSLLCDVVSTNRLVFGVHVDSVIM